VIVVLAGAAAGLAGCGSKSGSAHGGAPGDGSVGVDLDGDFRSSGGSGGGAGGQGGGAGRGVVGIWPPTMATNDAATLTPTPTGTCDPSALQRKKIPLVINGGSSDFGFGDAYLVATPSDPSTATFIGLVTNLGSTMHCNVAAPPNGYDWYDGQGKSHNVTTGPTILGSEGNTGSPIYVQSCLAPGETGVIADSQSMNGIGVRFDGTTSVFDQTASVALALSFTGDGTTPAPVLTPTMYRMDSPAGFTIFFSNVGTGTARLISYPPYSATYVAFDQGGLPLSIGGLDEITGGAQTYLVAPGEPGYSGSIVNLPGCATKLRVYIAFHAGDALN